MLAAQYATAQDTVINFKQQTSLIIKEAGALYDRRICSIKSFCFINNAPGLDLVLFIISWGK